MRQAVPNVEEIFFAALELDSPEARSAFLDSVCVDTEHRHRVEQFLALDHEANEYLEAPAVLEALAYDSRSPVEEPGSTVGRYRLMEVIGEGGMGVVYVAVQTEPVRRRVALKVIKPGMDTRQVVARFEAERQALAMMDHPNIATAYDAGMTPAGRPYFVMELVRGLPITEYCDREALTIPERLELFVLVCRAVQHAHQKGIIHRDLKPTNVLVTVIDGVPTPKVIDFGVAKAIGQPLTEKTIYTGFHQFVGTPLYVSPEQADLAGTDVDTRSDIYSLGVLLYELLTGTTPFDSETLGRAAFDEMRRMIREDEPPRPSTRLGSLGEQLSTVSARRKADPKRLGSAVKGELDWVVMKALEKDRSRRYETASDLSQDLLRYLSDEPVRACPPSSWYRFRKFVRRNRRSVSAASLILLALVAGVIGTTWGLIRAEQHRLVVERQRDELDRRNRALQAAHEHERLLNERARQAIEAVTSETAIEQLTREKELRPEQKEFLDKMIQYFAESTPEGDATEQERLRRARAYYRMGRLNQILGRFRDSETALRRAVALDRELVADFPDRSEYRQELATSLNHCGMLLGITGQLKEAEAAYTEVLAIYAQLAADLPSRPEFRQGLAGIHNNLGGLLYLDGERWEQAEAAFREALTIRKQLVADFPDRPVLRRALAMSHNNLGWLFQLTSRPKEAEASFGAAVAAQKLAVEGVPSRPEFRLELAKYQGSLGNALRASRRLKEAEAAFVEALSIEKQLAADFPARPDFRQELSGGLNNLGQLLCENGHFEAAEASYAEALAIRKQLAADFPGAPDYRNDVAGTLANLANAARRRRDFAASRRWVDEAFPYHREVLKAHPRNSEYRSYFRNSLAELAQTCSGLRDRSAALAAAARRRDLGWEPAADAYDAACMLARCVPIVAQSDTPDAAKRQAETQFYADQAMTMLRDAIAKGYRNLKHMKEDPELNVLREREDFKTLLAELQAERH